MGAPFERMKRAAFDAAVRTMGVPATWQGETQGVLFNRPDREEQRADIDFNTTHYEMEYRLGQFSGLYGLVRDGSVQTVNVSGTEYTVRHVMKMHDGDTYRAQLVAID